MEGQAFINYPHHVAAACGPVSAPVWCQLLQGRTGG